MIFLKGMIASLSLFFFDILVEAGGFLKIVNLVSAFLLLNYTLKIEVRIQKPNFVFS